MLFNHKHNIHHIRRSSPRRIPTSEVFTSFSPKTTTRTKPSSNNNKMARKYASHTTTERRGLFRRKVHHQKRHATLGDKIAGGLKKLKGTLTRNPAVKVRSLPSSSFYPSSFSHHGLITHVVQAAGTRRMHGTDGRGSHRH